MAGTHRAPSVGTTLMDEASAFVTGVPPVPLVPPADASRCSEGVLGGGCPPPGRAAPPLELQPAGYALKRMPTRRSQATGCPPAALLSLQPMRLRMAMTQDLEAHQHDRAGDTPRRATL